MEITLAMRVLDAMASQLEALKERIEMAEARIGELQVKSDCPCQTWREYTKTPGGKDD